MIYTALQSIQTILKALEDGASNKVFGKGGNNVIIGNDFIVHLKQLPLGVIHVTGGYINNKVVVTSPNVHIFGLCKDNDNITQTVLNKMELVIESGLKDLGWLMGPIAWNIHGNFLSLIGLDDLLIQPPFGNFHLVYQISKSLNT